MDENEMPVSADVSQEEIPENAKQIIIAALTDQEDEPEEYDIHSKQAITWRNQVKSYHVDLSLTLYRFVLSKNCSTKL